LGFYCVKSTHNTEDLVKTLAEGLVSLTCQVQKRIQIESRLIEPDRFSGIDEILQNLEYWVLKHTLQYWLLYQLER